MNYLGRSILGALIVALGLSLPGSLPKSQQHNPPDRSRYEITLTPEEINDYSACMNTPRYVVDLLPGKTIDVEEKAYDLSQKGYHRNAVRKCLYDLNRGQRILSHPTLPDLEDRRE